MISNEFVSNKNLGSGKDWKLTTSTDLSIHGFKSEHTLFSTSMQEKFGSSKFHLSLPKPDYLKVSHSV